MKKILSVFAMALAVLACNKAEEIVNPKVFELLTDVSALPSSEGSIDVKVNTDYTDFEVVIAAKDSWLTFVQTKSVQVAEKTFKFSYAENQTMSARKEVVRILSAGKTLGELVFVQQGSLPCIFEIPEVAQFSAGAGTLEIPVKVDYPDFEVSVESDWFSYIETKGIIDAVSKTLCFTYTANRTKSVRAADVKILSADKQIAGFTISQEAYDGLVLEKVYSRYSNGETPWCGFIPDIANRSMASDGKYIYLNSSEATAKIYAIEISSLLSGDAAPVYKSLPVAGVKGGTHAVSALACMANESGDPILIASNLAVDDSQNLNIYAYSSGIDVDPVLFHAYRWDGVANLTDWRRYGDRFSVSGTWQKGSLWFPSQSGTKVMVFHVENGATDAAHREYCWFDTFTGGLAETTLYPGSGEVLLTTASLAQFWTKNANSEVHPGGSWPKWDAGKVNESLAGSFNLQFFDCDGRNYIAYVQLSDNAHGSLKVVEDKGSLAESLSGEIIYDIPLYEGEEASCKAANTYGNCCVVKIEGKLHIVAMMQGGGLSIFEIK